MRKILDILLDFFNTLCYSNRADVRVPPSPGHLHFISSKDDFSWGS